jgi:hypothetical protein
MALIPWKPAPEQQNINERQIQANIQSTLRVHIQSKFFVFKMK